MVWLILKQNSFSATDMDFIKRLGWYMVGVVIGIFLVIFIFGDRDIQCSYFPNDRVLYDMGKKRLIISEDHWEELADKGIDSSGVQDMLSHGTVDFIASNVDLDSCKEYRVEHENWAARWQNCASELRLLGVEDR